MLRSSLWRSRSIALLVAVAALALPPETVAQTNGGLGFADERPLDITWQQLLGGQSMTLCNGSGTDASILVLDASGFGFKSGGKAEREETVIDKLTVLVPPGQSGKGVPAGACRDIVVSAAADAKVDPATYAGTIAVTARNVGIARLTMTVTVPPIPSAAGAVDEVMLTGRNRTPWGAPHIQGRADLLLKPATPTQAITVGTSCKQPGPGEQWNTATCPFLGNLYQGQRIISVYAAGKPTTEQGVIRLPVRLTDPGHVVGAYEGSLVLSGSDTIKTKLTTSDAWWCAVIALLLGASIPAALQLYSKWWRPTSILKNRADAIKTQYGTLRESTDLSHPNGYPDIRANADAVNDYADGVVAAIRAYRHTVLQVDEANATYKQIDASLCLAENDVQVLSGVGKLCEALQALESEVGKTLEVLADRASDMPQLLLAAGAPLRPAELGVGDATRRAKTASELAKWLGSWRQLAARLLRDETWLAALAEKRTSMSGRDGDVFDRTAMRLSELHGRLFNATNGEDVERLRISPEIEWAHTRLTYLGEHYNTPLPTAEESPAQYTFDREALTTKVSQTFIAALTGKGEQFTADQVTKQATDVPATKAKPVKARRSLLLLALDSIAMLVTLVVAVVAGLSAFFFGKSFGTFDDYLTVIFVGTAAQVVAKAVLDQLSMFWHDLAPQEPMQPATTS